MPQLGLQALPSDQQPPGPAVLEGADVGCDQPGPQETWVLRAKAGLWAVRALQPEMAASRTLLLPPLVSTNSRLSPGRCLRALLLATHLGDARRLAKWVEMEGGHGDPLGRSHGRCGGRPGECWTSAQVILGPARTLHSRRHTAGVGGGSLLLAGGPELAPRVPAVTPPLPWPRLQRARPQRRPFSFHLLLVNHVLTVVRDGVPGGGLGGLLTLPAHGHQAGSGSGRRVPDHGRAPSPLPQGEGQVSRPPREGRAHGACGSPVAWPL